MKVWETVGAGLVAVSPAWSASIVQLPAVTKVRAPPLVVVHTAVVDELKETGKPSVPVAEAAVAVSVGEVPKFCAFGLAKVMLCVPLGMAAFDAPDTVLVPIALVAVTVKV